MNKIILNKKLSGLLVFFFFCLSATFNTPMQAELNLLDEIAGNYSPKGKETTAWIHFYDQGNVTESSSEVFIRKSAKYPGRFKIICPDQDITAGGYAYTKIVNVVLDGVHINADGTIPRQEIKTTSAKTEAQLIYETGIGIKEADPITFIFRGGKPNRAACYIKKDTINPNSARYTLRLSLISKEKVLVMGAFSRRYYYKVDLFYNNVTRTAPLARDYPGMLRWNIVGEGEERLPYSPKLSKAIKSVSKGKKDSTYRIQLPSFKIGMNKLLEVRPIDIKNMKLDEQANFIPQTVSLVAERLFGGSQKSDFKITGSFKDSHLVLRLVGDFDIKNKRRDMEIEFNIPKSTTELARSVEENKIRIYTSERNIVVEGAQGNLITVYLANGVAVGALMASEKTKIPVSQGTYIVKVADKTEKLMLR